MAEQIPYGVASSLLAKLASAAFRELGRVYGVRDELERLKSTVESIKNVLCDAEEKQQPGNTIQHWITKLKGALYPAEDILDEFEIDDRMRKVHCSVSLNRLAFRYKMARKIEKAQKKFNELVQEMSQLNLIQRTPVERIDETVNGTRETDSFVLESDIIGREDTKKEIITLLKQPNESQNISVVAIVGIGGLGKTALAQLVYNDLESKHFFDEQIWVCVSQNFDVKAIVRKMLESLTKEKFDDKSSLQILQNRLRQALSGKKYLLVMDDNWNESLEEWTQLRKYLTCGTQDSKILVTTRSKIVAQKMGVTHEIDLKGLTIEESWSLLKKVAFGDDTIEVNQTLESIGKKIAEKCIGVPLAIRTLGGLLQGQSENSEWMKILHGDFWTLCEGGGEGQRSIMPVLKLSYQNLSPQMRQCFSYCSIFPEDWEIQKEKLIRLWMAQGYLQCSDDNESMEDVGNRFIRILLMRSFFQDVRMTEIAGDDIDSFKMHDLMHDLAVQVAGDDCCCLDGAAKRVAGRPMHVWVAADAVHLLDSLDPSRLRTLILQDCDGLNGKELSAVLKFKYLRALMIQSRGKNLPDSFALWKHLRFLQLIPDSDLEYVPKFISKLVCLQTLVWYNCPKVEFPQNDVSKLNTSLRYLQICRTEKMRGIKFLSSLTNIVEINFLRCRGFKNIPPSERLPFLKSLELRHLHELEYIYYEEGICPGGAFFPSLERICFIFCKQLRGWCRMGDELSDTNNCSQYHNLSFPRLSHLTIYHCEKLTWMPTFPKLDKSLELIACPREALRATIQSKVAVDFTPLSMLKSLVISTDKIKLGNDWMKNLISLQKLQLSSLPSQELHEMEISNLSLKTITISKSEDLEALPDWICNISSSLEHIRLQSCYRLVSLPEAMPRVQTLEIIRCHHLIEECKNAGRHKIAHIPNIIFK